MLYFVPTPIGNLKDITLRALEVLKSADIILAEDTRQTQKLLSHYEIENKVRSFHSHNEHKELNRVIDELKQDTTIALVSDAGTPGISDPGFLLARACMEEGIQMECIPGATAFVPALVKSGLTSDKFFFEGFLPHKKGRQTRLQFLSNLPHTFVLYESPYRVIKCLKELSQHCGSDRMASVSREITKLYEETTTATLAELISSYSAKTSIKGEFVIVVEGK